MSYDEEMASLRAKLAEATAQVAVMRKALHRYYREWHDDACKARSGCTCGRDDNNRRIDYAMMGREAP